eukprot:SAG22_NODE_404_length_11005_cov_8.751788_2_plen_191_part_00
MRAIPVFWAAMAMMSVCVQADAHSTTSEAQSLEPPKMAAAPAGTKPGDRGPKFVVRPWGANAIRVQICAGDCDDGLPGALETTAPTAAGGAAAAIASHRTLANGDGVTASGNLACKLTAAGNSLSFSRVEDGKLLLTQTALTPPAAATGGALTLDFSSSGVCEMRGPSAAGPTAMSGPSKSQPAPPGFFD